MDKRKFPEIQDKLGKKEKSNDLKKSKAKLLVMNTYELGGIDRRNLQRKFKPHGKGVWSTV